MTHNLLLFIASALVTVGCVNKPTLHSDYSAFRAANPRSILVVPPINNSVENQASECFLSTISEPLAQRGYYVFPVNAVRSVLADGSLSDADLLDFNDAQRIGQLVGADSVLYITIERWDAKYLIIGTAITVELNYSLRSAHTGGEIWKNHSSFNYTPTGTGGLAGPIIAAIPALLMAGRLYGRVAKSANESAILPKGTGLPAGPYDTKYLKDASDY